MGRRPTVISLFSGALGLDLGLEQAGFEIRVAVECNKFAVETIGLNRPRISVIQKRIEDTTTAEILAAANLEVGEPTVVTAGPSCQAFSTAGRRGSMEDPRGTLFREFLRVVNESRPRFFVMENVRGVLSAAIKHRPLNERGPGFPSLQSDEELGSAFMLILRELELLDYSVTFDLLNAADYGVPQTRERLLFIGSRDGEMLEIPKATHHSPAENKLPAWVALREGLRGLRDTHPKHTTFTKTERKYLQKIPPGGNWRALPKRMQASAIGAAYLSWGGRSGFLRRLSWSRPCPSLTTAPDGRATMLCHPDKLRPLSVKQYARLQGFPDSWRFAGGVPQHYKQIGNAVPVRMGKAIGQSLRKTMRADLVGALAKRVVCDNSELLARISKRPKTILNPIRMRKIKSKRAVIKWLSRPTRYRTEILEYGPDERAATG
jgi:DNA (cytosine-5)-methyltransferase 1